MKVVLFASREVGSIAASTVNFNVVGQGCAFAGTPTTESLSQMVWRVDGVMTNLYMRVSSNDRGTSTLVSRLNGSDGGMSVSITAATTGEFEDASGSDTIAPGDLYCSQITTGAGGTSFISRITGTLFEATSDTVTMLMTGDGGIFATAGATAYSIFGGSSGAPQTTEAVAQSSFRTGGVLSDFQVNIRVNARTTTSTARVRINGGNGNQVISVGAGVTGSLEDNTNTDTVASGDEVNQSITLGTGTGNFRYFTTGVLFTTTNNKTQILSGRTPGVAYVVGTTYFPTLGAIRVIDTTEADVRYEVNQGFTASNYSAYISVNGSSATSTITLRKNGADGNQTLSIGSGVTGFFEDTSNTDVFTATDEINHSIVVGAGGTSILVHSIDMLADYSVASPANVVPARTIRHR